MVAEMSGGIERGTLALMGILAIGGLIYAFC